MPVNTCFYAFPLRKSQLFLIQHHKCWTLSWNHWCQCLIEGLSPDIHQWFAEAANRVCPALLSPLRNDPFFLSLPLDCQTCGNLGWSSLGRTGFTLVTCRWKSYKGSFTTFRFIVSIFAKTHHSSNVALYCLTKPAAHSGSVSVVSAIVAVQRWSL